MTNLRIDKNLKNTRYGSLHWRALQYAYVIAFVSKLPTHCPNHIAGGYTAREPHRAINQPSAINSSASLEWRISEICAYYGYRYLLAWSRLTQTFLLWRSGLLRFMARGFSEWHVSDTVGVICIGCWEFTLIKTRESTATSRKAQKDIGSLSNCFCLTFQERI